MGWQDEKQWYVVNTYSGHENKVKENLEKRIETMGLQDVMFNIIVPEHEETEVKDGKKTTKLVNMFPGYILVEMIMTDDAWYVVRNTTGVTGFIGSSGGGAKPFPLSKAEVEPILRSIGIRADHVEIAYGVSDEVTVLAGPFKNSSGRVEAIDMDKQIAKVMINMFGRDTSVEVDILDLSKVEV